MTGAIRLRPVAEDDLVHLERMFSAPENIGVFTWTGWKNPRVFRRQWEEDGLLGGERRVLMIGDDDNVLGFVSWRPANPRPGLEQWELGISLFPEFRGKGYGTQAHRLVVRYLFDNTTANRVQAVTEVENVAEQRSLEKAGFTREGVLRGFGFRGGAFRDEVIYGILREDIDLSD